MTQDSTVQSLFRMILDIRDRHADASEETLRPLLANGIEQGLGVVPESERPELIDHVEQRLREHARSEAAELKALRQKVSELEASLAAAKSSGGTASSGGDLDLRAVIRQAANSPDSIASSDADAGKLLGMLVQFSLDSAQAVAELRRQFNLGSAPGNTQIIKQLDLRFRSAFDSFLGGEGGVEDINRELEHTKQFIYYLNKAYRTSSRGGMRDLLASLEPTQFLQQTRGRFTADHEKAFDALARKHAEVSAFTADELWELFFKEGFQKTLSEAPGS